MTTTQPTETQARATRQSVDGALARQNREPIESSPYAVDDPQRVEWERGWLNQEWIECYVETAKTTEQMPPNAPVSTETASESKGEDSIGLRYERVLKRQREIEGDNQSVIDSNGEVSEWQSAVEIAKSGLKGAIEKRDRRVIELSRRISDSASGQNRLPFEDGLKTHEAPLVDAWLDSPISELGLTKSQAAKLTEAEILTIGNLEKHMTDKPHTWHECLAKRADAKPVEAVREAWIAFRLAHPQPQPDSEPERPPTILEKLSVANEVPF